MGYELEVVHPATERWFDRNSFQYLHHYSFLRRSIIDFVAWQDDDVLLIVECKAHVGLFEQAMKQVKRYTREIEEHRAKTTNSRFLPRWMRGKRIVPTVVFPYPGGDWQQYEDEADSRGVWAIALYNEHAYDWPANIDKALHEMVNAAADVAEIKQIQEL